MTRGFWLGLGAAAVSFLVLVAIAAPLTDSATDTVAASNRSWLISCAIAGLIAGFLGARIAHTAPLAARYAAAITGPALLGLLFALTTDPAEGRGPWLALVIIVAAAALGAAGRERLAR